MTDSDNTLFNVGIPDLCRGIELLETYRPGWWWSIHIERDRVHMSLGPDHSACAFDRRFMKTKLGDTGFHYESVEPVRVIANHLLDLSRKALLTFDPPSGRPPLGPPEPKRKTPWDDPKFVARMLDLTNRARALAVYPHIRQFMFGSCFRSADCSIRIGKDISFDADMFRPGANIADALNEVLMDGDLNGIN